MKLRRARRRRRGPTVEQLVPVPVVREVFEIVDRVVRNRGGHAHTVFPRRPVCPLGIDEACRAEPPRHHRFDAALIENKSFEGPTFTLRSDPFISQVFVFQSLMLERGRENCSGARYRFTSAGQLTTTTIAATSFSGVWSERTGFHRVPHRRMCASRNCPRPNSAGPHETTRLRCPLRCPFPIGRELP